MLNFNKISVHTQGNLRENIQTGAYVCHNHATEYKDIGNVELNGTKGEALMDDDECENECPAHHNDCNGAKIQEINKTDEETLEEKVVKDQTEVTQELRVTDDAMSVEVPPHLDEPSSRGAIVEVSPRLTRARSTKDISNK